MLVAHNVVATSEVISFYTSVTNYSYYSFIKFKLNALPLGKQNKDEKGDDKWDK